jgi:hypothetical protein
MQTAIRKTKPMEKPLMRVIIALRNDGCFLALASSKNSDRTKGGYES